MINPGEFAAFAVITVSAISALSLVGAVARRIGGPRGRTARMMLGMTNAENQQSIDELRDEVDRLRTERDDTQVRLRRLDEMDERLDFAERLLAKARDQGALPGGR